MKSWTKLLFLLPVHLQCLLCLSVLSTQGRSGHPSANQTSSMHLVSCRFEETKLKGGGYHGSAKGRQLSNNICLTSSAAACPLAPLSSSSPTSLVTPTFQDNAHIFQHVHFLRPLTFKNSTPPIFFYPMNESINMY